VEKTRSKGVPGGGEGELIGKIMEEVLIGMEIDLRKGANESALTCERMGGPADHSGIGGCHCWKGAFEPEEGTGLRVDWSSRVNAKEGVGGG